ncbi:hypothetical protein [Bacillus paramycoides]|uniref:hypothetical protein n=1 Tax=Bacillus paramycoides TaxID=2026194 RepID=UPI0038053E34
MTIIFLGTFSFFIFIIIFLQNALSIYKTNFIYYVYLLMSIPFIQLTRKLFFRRYITFTIIVITVLLGIGIIVNISNSQSIATRTNQIEDYLGYINKNYKSTYLIGSGIGTPYESLPESEDLGEIKKIDLDNSLNINYKFIFQIPVLFIFKYAGIIGVIWFLIFWGSVMLGGTTPFFIFLGFLIGRYSILRKKLYQQT